MKKFLENNKIYFEMTSSIMFGAAALFISLAAYHLSKEQLEVSKISSKPHFYIEEVLIKDPKTKKYNDAELYIKNAGVAAYNINVKTYEFIEVQYFDKEKEDKKILISGYYSAQLSKHSPVGLVSTLIGPGNNEAMAKLDSSSLDYIQKNDDYFEFKLVSLVVISYLDKFNEKKTEYFLNRSQVDRSEIDKLIRIGKNQFPVNLRMATVEFLLETAKNGLTSQSTGTK